MPDGRFGFSMSATLRLPRYYEMAGCDGEKANLYHRLM